MFKSFLHYFRITVFPPLINYFFRVDLLLTVFLSRRYMFFHLSSCLAWRWNV